MLYRKRHVVFPPYFALGLFTLFFHSPMYGQQHVGIIDAAAQKMQYYAASKSPASLFVHFDKNIYTNGETAWFAGYVLQSDTALATVNTLSIALFRNSDRKIMCGDKFVIRNGLSSGSILLPDSLSPGDYDFIAFTNRKNTGDDADVFVQPVTIKTFDSGFSASLQLLDTADNFTHNTRIALKVNTNGHEAVSGASYTATLNGITLDQNGGNKTNRQGECVITVPAGLRTTGTGIVHVLVKYGNLYRDIPLQLPAIKQRPVVKFYPEGGNLAAGLPCTIGWEIKTPAGEPLQLSGILYDNGKEADTIQTSLYGMGRFTFTPVTGHVYTVRLKSADAGDTLYTLPPAMPSIPSIAVENALAGDTLHLQLHFAANNLPLFLILHNYREIFKAYVIRNESQNGFINITLSGVPKGPAVLTVADSLGNPITERLFFAHYKRQANIIVSTDRQQYKTRQKVEMTVQLTTPLNSNDIGVVSIACVQNNRLDAKKMTDIESYTYLARELQSFPFPHQAIANFEKNNEYLQDILLIKGWRRYSWPSLMTADSSIIHHTVSAFSISGSVTKEDSRLKKPVEVGLLADSVPFLIKTTASGNFVIPYEILVLPLGKKAFLFVNGPGNDLYKIHVHDPFEQENVRIAGALQQPEFDVAETHEAELIIKDGRSNAILKPVTVRAVTSQNINLNGTLNLAGVNECGDYVCVNGVLNCPMHKNALTNRRPIIGNNYYIYGSGIPTGVKYTGCTTQPEKPPGLFISLNGIYRPSELYGPNDEVIKAEELPFYLSTLFWQAGILVNGNNKLHLSFYTGDIPGRFKIIIQGRTNGDVVYGESTFTVTK
ncbi:MAG TPA: hypothetical protein VG738_11810 [Chitinophagaceae bacterium]|nr:hypothetical protein [Chitinophagaceae bacterium]